MGIWGIARKGVIFCLSRRGERGRWGDRITTKGPTFKKRVRGRRGEVLAAEEDIYAELRLFQGVTPQIQVTINKRKLFEILNKS